MALSLTYNFVRRFCPSGTQNKDPFLACLEICQEKQMMMKDMKSLQQEVAEARSETIRFDAALTIKAGCDR